MNERPAPDSAPVWHALLAPLPPDAAVRASPVLDAATAAAHAASPVAGWTQLVVELSAGAAGLRMVLVVVDADGAPVSASDAVLYMAPFGASSARRIAADAAGEPVTCVQESLGGRIEADGEFRGTRWLGLTRQGAEPAGDEEAGAAELTSSAPTAAEADALLALVADVRRRWRAAAGEGDAPA